MVMLVYEDLGSDKPSFFLPDKTDKCISRFSEWQLILGWHARHTMLVLHVVLAYV